MRRPPGTSIGGFGRLQSCDRDVGLGHGCSLRVGSCTFDIATPRYSVLDHAAHGHPYREARSPLVRLVHQGSDPTLPEFPRTVSHTAEEMGRSLNALVEEALASALLGPAVNHGREVTTGQSAGPPARRMATLTQPQHPIRVDGPLNLYVPIGLLP